MSMFPNIEEGYTFCHNSILRSSEWVGEWVCERERDIILIKVSAEHNNDNSFEALTYRLVVVISNIKNFIGAIMNIDQIGPAVLKCLGNTNDRNRFSLVAVEEISFIAKLI